MDGSAKKFKLKSILHISWNFHVILHTFSLTARAFMMRSTSPNKMGMVVVMTKLLKMR